MESVPPSATSAGSQMASTVWRDHVPGGRLTVPTLLQARSSPFHVGPRAASRGQRGFSCLLSPLLPPETNSLNALMPQFVCSSPQELCFLPRGLALTGFSGASPSLLACFSRSWSFETCSVPMLYLLSPISFCWSFLLPSG